MCIRDSYLGENHSGYNSFAYDITDYLNYGGENVIAVRADATIEEGWYYEGAGIYRHVWLTKTAPLHIARYGTFVTTGLAGDTAKLAIRTTIINEFSKSVICDVEQFIEDAKGKIIAKDNGHRTETVSYTHLTLPTNREV